MNKLKIGVLGSTKGTDSQRVIDECNAGRLDAEITLVVSNRKDAYILERAKKHGIEAVFVDPKGFRTREEFDNKVVGLLKEKDVELVLLIGYDRILGPGFVDSYPNSIMNIHPSILPAFRGEFDQNVHKRVLDSGVKLTGCTLHFVDNSVDEGPIIVQKPVEIEEGETPESLKDKVQKAEQQAILEGIRLFQAGRLQVKGKKAHIK